MKDFKIPFTQRQEQFSIAYINAIASVAGYSVEEFRVDVGSVDVSIMQIANSDDFPLIQSLRVQLKCTYAHTPRNGFINFPLSIKNYNDLRRPYLNPHILIVVHTPRNIEDWIEHQDEYMLLKHVAYWKSLENMPDVKNKDNITINISTTQKFTVIELQRLMNILSSGQKP